MRTIPLGPRDRGTQAASTARQSAGTRGSRVRQSQGRSLAWVEAAAERAATRTRQRRGWDGWRGINSATFIRRSWTIWKCQSRSPSNSSATRASQRRSTSTRTSSMPRTGKR